MIRTTNQSFQNRFALNKILLCSGMLTLLPMAAINAQETKDKAEELEIIEVTGVVSSLKRALAEKRASDVIKDVISAEDIGKLPDQNLAEALQRITGVQIGREFGEGDSVAVRGLTQNRVEVNGQTTIGSDSQSRGVRFNDLSPDAFSSIEVIKTPTADVTEGSLGATINLKTRRALDSKGNVLSGRVNAEYTEDADTVNPNVSFFGSTRWDTSLGEMGVTVALSYSDQDRTRDTSEARWQGYSNKDVDGDGSNDANIFLPRQMRFQSWAREQERTSITSSFQWAFAKTGEFYIDANYTNFDIATASSQGAVDLNGARSFTDATLTGNNTLLIGTADRSRFSTTSWDQRSDRTTYAMTFGTKYNWDKLSMDASATYANGEEVIDNAFFSYIGPQNTVAAFNVRDTDLPVVQLFEFNSTVPVDTLDINNYRVFNLLIQDPTRETDNTEAKLDFDYALNSENFDTFEFGARWASRTALRARNQLAIRTVANQPVSNFQFLVDTTETFPADFLEGFSGGFREFLTPNNRNFFDNRQPLEEVLGVDSTDLVNQSEIFDDFFDIEETVNAAYLKANFFGELGDAPFQGNFGVRHVNTDIESLGYVKAGPESVLQLQTNDYSDTLLSANIQFELNDDMVLRFAAADVMSRPNIIDLSSAVILNVGNDTGRSGNVNLEPFRATQYDVSFEWYRSETDFFSFAVFYKDVESFIQTLNEIRFLQVPGTEDFRDFSVNLPSNGEGGEVQGVEVGFTQTFAFLGDKFENSGISVNYTYADSETSNLHPITEQILPLEDLSKDSYNIVAFYEYGAYSARIAYNWRSEFLDKTSGFNNQPEFERDRSQTDFSASYAINKSATLTFEALNLTNESNDRYSSIEERDAFKSSVGRRFTLGVRARF